MADALKITDRESLERWLQDKPADWAQLIALRAALRVFPLVVQRSVNNLEQDVERFQGLVLAVWRCLFSSSVCRNYPTDDSRAASGYAADAAAAAKAADYAADTSRAAAAAAARAVSSRAAGATTAAIRAADAATTAVTRAATFPVGIRAGAFPIGISSPTSDWETIRCDCSILGREGLEKLEAAPLWVELDNVDDPEHEPSPVIATPRWAANAAARLPDDLTRLLGPDAKLIADWYQPLLTGDASANWSRMFLGDRAQRLALRKDAFWEVTEEREAETIMGDIAAALGWETRNPWGVEVAEIGDESFIFLSHARADRPRATAIRQLLLDQGIPVWWDDDIAGGDGWRDRIAERLEKAAAVLTLWTEHSVSRDAVREEAARAQAARKLVHARLDKADLPYGFGETHYIDLCSWDGTATHEWRKLVDALRDKLSPPDADEIRQRLSDSSPVAMVAEAGKLSPRDTPPTARPVVTNAPDLEQRIAGIRQSYSAIRPRVDSGHYQVPRDLPHSLDFVAVTINAEPLTWYAIEDSCHSLCDCMADHDAVNSWNATLVRDLDRLAGRLRELRPLLQPAQVLEGQPGAKPPEPEPFVAPDNVPDIETISSQLQEILDSDEAREVLSDGAVQLGEAGAAQVKEASRETDPDKQLPALRRGLKRMTYVTGGILAAIGGGVTINLLTAPEAAVTLAARLKPLYDMMVRFFM